MKKTPKRKHDKDRDAGGFGGTGLKQEGHETGPLSISLLFETHTYVLRPSRKLYQRQVVHLADIPSNIH
jgi:hypothetical protein